MNQRPLHRLKLRLSPLWLVGARRPDPKEFEGLFNRLREAAGALQDAEAGLEAQFLNIGAGLERMAGFGHEFVRQVEKLVGLATGKECDNATFLNPVRLVERSTVVLEECQRRTDALVGHLRSYHAQIGSLLGTESALRRTMLPLRFVQVLFKVECAPLSPEIQQLFGTLTDEIEHLQGQMREIFGTNFKQLEQTQKALEEVILQLERQECSLRAAIAAHKSRIGETLASLRRELSSNQQREVQLNDLSQAVAREVEQVVMSLQFQDIVHQKLQHVLAELPRGEAGFSEASRSGSVQGFNRPMNYLWHSCRLQDGQLKSAREELVRAEAGIQRGIGSVLANLRELDSRCLSLEEFQLLTTSTDGMVQVLIETMEQVRKLMRESVSCTATAYEMLRPLGGLASNLTVITRELAARIHVFGLNAQVQAAQVGQQDRGAELAILSQRTSEICGETNRISELAAHQLDGLAAGLASCVQEFGELRSEVAAQEAALSLESLAEEKSLHAFRDGGLQTLCAIGTSLDGIRDEAHLTLDRVRFSDFCQTILPALQAPLRALAAAAERWLDTRGDKLHAADLIGSLKDDYTMASEREVFDRLTAGERKDPEPGCPAPGAGEISPWIDVLPAATAGLEPDRPAVPAQTGEATGNVELF